MKNYVNTKKAVIPTSAYQLYHRLCSEIKYKCPKVQKNWVPKA